MGGDADHSAMRRVGAAFIVGIAAVVVLLVVGRDRHLPVDADRAAAVALASPELKHVDRRGLHHRVVRVDSGLVKVTFVRQGRVVAEAGVRRNGVVTHSASGRTLNYGQLVDTAAKLPVPTNVKLKEPKAFTIIGKSIRRLDSPDKVNGRAQFGIVADRVPRAEASIDVHDRQLRRAPRRHQADDRGNAESGHRQNQRTAGPFDLS